MLNVKLIDSILEEKGWRDADLARALGIQRQHMSIILRVNESCSVKTLVKLAKVLGVTINDLWVED